MQKMLARLFLLILAGVAPVPAIATDVIDAAGISSLTQQFLDEWVAQEMAANGGRITAETGKIDPRTRFPACARPSVRLESEPGSGTRNSLLVSCDGARPWKMFVSATIRIERQIWVAAAPIARGTRLNASHLTQAWRSINDSSRAFFTGPANQLTGMVVRRDTSAGDPFFANQLTPPTAINRGDSIMISARAGSLGVEMPGTALANGKVGQQIPVRNDSSQRVVRGVVSGPGRVEVVF